jgi:nucleoid DNA-binding protein
MNKTEFVNYIAEKNNLKKTEAEKIINIFTDAVVGSVSEGKELALVGFGSFTVSKVAAREGRNPKTNEPLNIEAYNQVRFKVGQKLKDACNSGKKS